MERAARREPVRAGWTTTAFRIAAAVVVLLGAGLLWQRWQTDREGSGRRLTSRLSSVRPIPYRSAMALA